MLRTRVYKNLYRTIEIKVEKGGKVILGGDGKKMGLR